MEEWAPVGDEFPNYSVSTYGRVRNDLTKRILSQAKNNTGYMKVGINNYDGIRCTLEVTRLVATTFLPGRTDSNSTPIHLDGNKEHTFLDNLAWRPRWFAARYHAQFKNTKYRMTEPIVELKTGRVFDDSLQAARAFGVLERDIVLSTVMHDDVYPDGYTFRLQSDV
jgi:hypothetical protein